MNKNKEKIELKVHKAKAPRMTSIEETIQLARLQQAVTSSALYERKHDQKALKVITVAAYILFVSMAAITLSFYYVFIWDPSTKPIPPRNSANCENKVVIPESLAIRLANSTEITAENFFKNIFRSYQAIQNSNYEKYAEIKSKPTAFNTTSDNIIKSINVDVSSTLSSSESTIEEHAGNNDPILPLASASSSGLLSLASLIQQPYVQHSPHQDDDEDRDGGDVDYEASGSNKFNWNDTTIQLDEDTNKNNKL